MEAPIWVVLQIRVPFLGPQYSTAPLFKKDPKRDPTLANYPPKPQTLNTIDPLKEPFP